VASAYLAISIPAAPDEAELEKKQGIFEGICKPKGKNHDSR